MIYGIVELSKKMGLELKRPPAPPTIRKFMGENKRWVIMVGKKKKYSISKNKWDFFIGEFQTFMYYRKKLRNERIKEAKRK